MKNKLHEVLDMMYRTQRSLRYDKLDLKGMDIKYVLVHYEVFREMLKSPDCHNYINFDINEEGRQIPSIWGVPIIETGNIPSDQFEVLIGRK
jgi:hypothetical protein